MKNWYVEFNVAGEYTLVLEVAAHDVVSKGGAVFVYGAPRHRSRSKIVGLGTVKITEIKQ